MSEAALLQRITGCDWTFDTANPDMLRFFCQHDVEVRLEMVRVIQTEGPLAELALQALHTRMMTGL